MGGALTTCGLKEAASHSHQLINKYPPRFRLNIKDFPACKEAVGCSVDSSCGSADFRTSGVEDHLSLNK